MSQKINALIVVKEPGKAPERRTLPVLDLEAMQGIVGGHIEYIPLQLSFDTLDLFLNEEGKLDKLEPNVWVFEKQDVVCGTLFVCTNTDEGESIGLTEEEAEAAIAFLNENDMTAAERLRAAAVIDSMF